MSKVISCGNAASRICFLLALPAIVPVRLPAQAAQSVPEIVQAVQRQDNAALKRCLDAKADPNAESRYYAGQPHSPESLRTLRDRTGAVVRVVEPQEIFTTPLKIAAMSDDFEAVKLLLDAGAKVDKADALGETPLMETANVKIMRLLIEHGANVNAQASPMGFTPLLLSVDRSLEGMRLLIARGANVNLGLFNGVTPLMRAAISEDNTLPKMQLLLKHGAKPLAKTKGGVTALMFACQFRVSTRMGMMTNAPMECIRLLVGLGANVNARAEQGGTALQTAVAGAYGDKTELTRYLLQKHANPNTRDSAGESPLKGAVYGEKLHVVELLLTHGAKPDLADATGATPLLWAVGRDNPDMVALLVNAGANVNRGDKGGKTPLLWACSKGNPKIVRLLLAHGVDVTVPTRDGRTALHIARAQNHPKIVRLLVQAGAKR